MFRNKGHKLGSLESILSAVRYAIKLESDLIVFSHDDVYINNYKLLQENIEHLNSKSIVLRRPIQPDANYFMYDAFIIKTIIEKQFSQRNIN